MNPPRDTNDRNDEDQWDLSRWDLTVVDGPDDEDEWSEDETDPALEAAENLDEDRFARRGALVRRAIRFIALVALIFFATTFAAPQLYQSIRSIIRRPAAPDYLSAVKIELDGWVLRFHQDEIRYSIVIPSNYPQTEMDRLEQPLLRAMDSWERALDNKIEFLPASPSGGDDLLISFVTELKSAGVTSMRPGNRYRPEIAIKFDVESSMPSEITLETVALHELGHALGLWGHSDYEGDAMYPMASRRTLSARDVRTIRELYDLEETN